MKSSNLKDEAAQLQLSAVVSERPGYKDAGKPADAAGELAQKVARMTQIVGHMQGINQRLAEENGSIRARLAARDYVASERPQGENSELQQSYNSLLVAKYDLMRQLDERERQIATLQCQFSNLSALALRLAELALRRAQ